MTKYLYTPEDLAAAVAQSISVAGVMRILGIKPAGGSHFHVSTRIKKAGLDTSHFLGKTSTKGGRFPRLKPSEILVRRDPRGPRAKPHLLRRALLEMGIPDECVQCATPNIWENRHLILHVDHIDGDAWNNEIDNLRFLCPNCHSQTSTYCRKMSARAKENAG